MANNKVKWKRHSAVVGGPSMTISGGSDTIWTATINGTHVVIMNMYGQSVALTGWDVAAVFVWVADHPDDPFAEKGGHSKVHSDYRVRDAKEWAVKEYSQ